MSTAATTRAATTRAATTVPDWSGGAVATPHAGATRAGYRALASGGNAIDAALAAAAMLTVVYPHQCSIGGDAIALVGTPDGSATVVNGSGRSAAVLDPADYVADDGFAPVLGARSVTVPGILDAWRILADRWGSRPLADALGPAVAAARAGVPVAPGVHRDLVREHENLAADQGTREVFFRDGRLLAVGEVLALDRLADTLTALAGSGPEAFYSGEIARSVGSRLRELGSDLTLDDFAGHRSTIEEARSVEFAGEEYLSSAGNSQGTFFLRGLGAIERVARETGSDPGGVPADVVARILALAAVERDLLLADAGHGDRPVEELLAAGSVQELAAAGRSGAPIGALVTDRRRPPQRTGDTVAVVTADAQGNWVSLIQSAFHAFGSCVLDPATGVLLHNRGASFSLHPDSPNRLAPGKRPAHTLMPVLVRRGGVIVGAHGTMGGRAQPQIHTHLAMNLASGLDPRSAVSRPRWVVGQLEAGAAGRDDAVTVAVERGVAADATRLLRASGFATRELPALDDEVGHLQVIRRGPASDGFRVASDPRSDGLDG